MRWAQLTLVENDPGNFDLDFWLDYFRRVHADGACLSAGGYVAYYPTDIPLHHRSAWLGDAGTQSPCDPFGDLVAGCRAMDMAVLARTDPHAIHQDAADAHPEWIAVDAEGNPRRHWSKPDAWVTCALGPYNFEFMTEVHKEIVARYRVDGIFSNRWAGHGMCYCEHCQRTFREATGMELPRTREPGTRETGTRNLRDPVWRAYLLWRQERLFALCRLWDDAIRAINPRACYIPNSGGGALSSLDMKQLSELTPLLFADKQSRQGITPPWANGKNAKEFRAVYGRKPIGGIFSVGLEEKYRWKDSVQSEAELRVWVASAVANGMRPWFTKFSGQIYDRRWLPVVEDIFTWHARNERYLRNTASLARIAVVYSQQTAAFYGGEQAQQKVEDPILGVYQALIEARIPFEMVHDGLLDADHLAPFKTLILPNVAVLSDAQCDQLRAFVARGGSLVATFETSLYDEHGAQREDFGLADLFGVRFVGPVEGPLKNAYLNPEPAAAIAPMWLAGLEEAGRFIYGGYHVPVEATEPAYAPPLTLVLPYPDLPMEEVYPRQPHTDIPGVYCRQVDGGRIVYFPWDIDRIFWEVLNADHGLLLRNAVQWATDEESPVVVTGPGVLDVTIWRQENSLTVHLVNLTNPMMMRGSFRSLMPAGAQEVRVRLPEGVRAGQVRLLKFGNTSRVDQEDGHFVITVPGIVDFEVVAIDIT
ncbi:MAG: beta-galactosidase trimerization domain-containing protein [Anaerolineae bacterium]|nr:beta-galactosidase trimerization domain-containing protein [Anaerolineae bacterium]